MRQISMKGLLALIVVVLLASCSETSEYVNVVPKDAAMVISLNLKSLGEKTTLGENKEMAEKWLSDNMKKQMSKAAYIQLEALVKNPTEAGLSLTDPLYMFISPNFTNIGLIAKVADSDKLNKLFVTLQENNANVKMNEEDGSVWLISGTEVVGVFNENVLLLMPVVDGGKEYIKGLLKQSASESFASTVGMQRLDKTDGDIAVYGSLEVMPEPYASQIAMASVMGVDMKALRYAAGISFEKGKIVVKSCSYDMPKDLMEKQKKMVRKLDGEFMDYLSSKSVFWMAMNINGAAYYELMTMNPMVKQQLNSLPGVDMEALLSSIDGEIAAEWSGIAEKMPEFTLYAEVKDKSLVDYITNMLGSQVPGLYYGQKDNKFYITTNHQVADTPCKEVSLPISKTSWAKQMKGSYGYIMLNTTMLCNILMQQGVSNNSMEGILAMSVLNSCEYIEINNVDFDKSNWTIQLKDCDTNALKQIIDGMSKL